MAHLGLQHGLTGSAIHPLAQRTMKATAGPEALTSYEAAHAIGKNLAHLPTEEQHNVFHHTLNQTIGKDALQNAPIAGPVRQAMMHEVSGTAPTLKAHGGGLNRVGAEIYSRGVGGMSRLTNTPFDTPLQRAARGAVAAVPIAAGVAADPIGMGMHAGFNTGREIVGNSKWGKGKMEEMLNQGLEGKTYSPGAQKAIDYAVSPALLDPMRIGHAIHQTSPAAAHTLRDLGADPDVRTQVGAAVSNPQAAAQRLRSRFAQFLPSAPSASPVVG